MTKKNKKILILSIVLAVVIFNPISLFSIFFGMATWSNTHPDKGENVKSVSWLPKEATDICFYETYSFTAFEFNISEQGFMDWAKKWKIKKNVEPVGIMRYTQFTLPQPKSSSDPTGEKYKEYQSKIKIRIKNGLYYRTPPRPNGGGTYVGYDLDTGRAYYQSSPR